MQQHTSEPTSIDSSEALSPYEDTSREYRAMRGKRTGGHRVLSVLFVPNEGTHNRTLPCADLRLMDTAKNGTELLMEYSAMTVAITGRNLTAVGEGIGAGWVASLEAFSPEARDAPPAGAPVIERIAFYPVERPQEVRLSRSKPRLVKPD